MTKCPVCALPANIRDISDSKQVVCFRCGKYELAGTAHSMLVSTPLSSRQISCASGWLHEHQGISLNSQTVSFLRELRVPSVGDKATKLLQALATIHPIPGEQIRFQTRSLSKLMNPPEVIKVPNDL